MPPKRKQTNTKRKKTKKKQKIINWEADEHFDQNRVMVYVEYSNECPIFENMANQLVEFLQKRYPQKEFLLIRNRQNTVQPRFGAFEVSVSQNARTPEELLWSGIDRGPPRHEKFPKSWENIAVGVGNLLKRIYIIPKGTEKDDEDEGEGDRDSLQTQYDQLSVKSEL